MKLWDAKVPHFLDAGEAKAFLARMKEEAAIGFTGTALIEAIAIIRLAGAAGEDDSFSDWGDLHAFVDLGEEAKQQLALLVNEAIILYDTEQAGTTRAIYVGPVAPAIFFQLLGLKPIPENSH